MTHRVFGITESEQVVLQKTSIGYLEVQELEFEAEIHHVEVAPSYRRRGFAEKLIRYFINNTLCKEIYLEVSVQNLPATSLYQKLGFEIIGIRKNYYKRPDGIQEDAYNMKLILVQ